jgi:hypothetical protein
MGVAVSEYTFGDGDPGYTPDLSEQAPPGAEPKWFRERMDKVSEQVNALVEENSRLKQAQARNQVADALTAKGYAPSAAELYTGVPEKLDDWLTAHGGALAKLPAEGQEQGTGQPLGVPATVVPADGQEQMRRMQEAGTQGVAPPQGSDKELAAAIAAVTTEAEFDQLMKSHGSRHDWNS